MCGGLGSTSNPTLSQLSAREREAKLFRAETSSPRFIREREGERPTARMQDRGRLTSCNMRVPAEGGDSGGERGHLPGRGGRAFGLGAPSRCLTEAQAASSRAAPPLTSRHSSLRPRGPSLRWALPLPPRSRGGHQPLRCDGVRCGAGGARESEARGGGRSVEAP